MKRKYSRSLVLVLVLVAASCAKAPPSLSPAGTAAFQATRVVKALDVLSDFVIAAEAQTPKVISTANTRTIGNFVTAAAKTIDAAPGGWKPTVLAGLDQLQHDILPAEWQRVLPYVTLIKALIQEIP